MLNLHQKFKARYKKNGQNEILCQNIALKTSKIDTMYKKE